MKVLTISIDLAKTTYSLHGVDLFTARSKFVKR